MKMSITVRGKQHEWCFGIETNPKYLAEWRADGLDIDPVLVSIPTWIVNLGLMGLWCWLFEDKEVEKI
jgi:hypothetical protein